MILDRSNYEEKINSYTYQDWKPLLELIPQIEGMTNFGTWTGLDNHGKKFF